MRTGKFTHLNQAHPSGSPHHLTSNTTYRTPPYTSSAYQPQQHLYSPAPILSPTPPMSPPTPSLPPNSQDERHEQHEHKQSIVTRDAVSYGSKDALTSTRMWGTRGIAGASSSPGCFVRGGGRTNEQAGDADRSNVHAGVATATATAWMAIMWARAGAGAGGGEAAGGEGLVKGDGCGE
jgi:hypothetical protein